jgi:hypothetical protein
VDYKCNWTQRVLTLHGVSIAKAPRQYIPTLLPWTPLDSAAGLDTEECPCVNQDCKNICRLFGKAAKGIEPRDARNRPTNSRLPVGSSGTWSQLISTILAHLHCDYKQTASSSVVLPAVITCTGQFIQSVVKNARFILRANWQQHTFLCFFLQLFVCPFLVPSPVSLPISRFLFADRLTTICATSHIHLPSFVPRHRYTCHHLCYITDTLVIVCATSQIHLLAFVPCHRYTCHHLGHITDTLATICSTSQIHLPPFAPHHRYTCHHLRHSTDTLSIICATSQIHLPSFASHHQTRP